MPTVPPIGVNDLTTQGPEWNVGGVGGIQDGTQAAQGPNGFGGMLENSIQSLDSLQTKAADASQALASGQATVADTQVDCPYYDHFRLCRPVTVAAEQSQLRPDDLRAGTQRCPRSQRMRLPGERQDAV